MLASLKNFATSVLSWKNGEVEALKSFCSPVARHDAGFAALAQGHLSNNSLAIASSGLPKANTVEEVRTCPPIDTTLATANSTRHGPFSQRLVPRRIWWLVIFGATVGAALDYLHTHGDEILYPEGTNHWRGIGTFAVVYSVGPLLFLGLFGAQYRTLYPPPYSRSLAATVVYCCLYAFTAYADIPSDQIAVVLAVAVVVLWWTVERTRTAASLLQTLVAGFACASMESFLAHVVESMTYVSQDIIGIPYWLPLLYSVGIVSVVQVARRFLFYEDHRSVPSNLDGVAPTPCPTPKVQASDNASCAKQTSHREFSFPSSDLLALTYDYDEDNVIAQLWGASTDRLDSLNSAISPGVSSA